jgi:transposase
MPRFKSYNYNQSMMVPVNLEDQITEGTLEFAIHYLIDHEMDLSIFDEKFINDETGCPAYDPKILLKIILFGYSRGFLSSRQLERACRENIIFMALTCGQAPDHCTISRFVSSMDSYILPLFRNILLVCENENLLGGTVFAIDGCKLPGNASKHWSGTISELKHKAEKLDAKIQSLLQNHQSLDEEAFSDSAHADKAKLEKRINRLQRRLASVRQWSESGKPKIGQSGKEIKSNVTDNDSAKMLTSHGTLQGYNAQAMVDDKHQIILYGEAMSKGQDFAHLKPVVTGAVDNVKELGHNKNYFKNKKILGDSNYHSDANLQFAKKQNIDAYIPDPRFRQRDPRFAHQGKYKPPKPRKKFTIDEYEYDEATDSFTCPNGVHLKLIGRTALIKGNIYKRYRGPDGTCDDCPLKSKCMNSPSSKRKYLSVKVGVDPKNLSKEMIDKIDSDAGRKIYQQRIAIVEPVFGNIRSVKRMDRFTMRGKQKVNAQWNLFCLVHNIEKIMRYSAMFAQNPA